jgi:hypothetical protein
MSDQTIELTQQRLTIEGHATLATPGDGSTPTRFEILAITAGVGNGWTFSEDALQSSLKLWDGLECFIDHQQFFSSGRSLRDLAGVCSAPAWSEDQHGIGLTLTAAGPSAPLLKACAQEWLAAADAPGPGSAFRPTWPSRPTTKKKYRRSSGSTL